MIRVHLKQSADALFLLLDRIENSVARLEHAGVDTKEGQRANERVGGNLECESGERRIIGRRTLDARVLAVLVYPAYRGHVDGCRKELHNRIEQRLERPCS